MKDIQLTHNKVALVDDADYEELSKYKWWAYEDHGTWYASRSVKLPSGRHRWIYMHRQILGLEFGDRRQGDHFNHDGLDNRRENLRIVTHQQNQWNRRGTKGYYWNKLARKFHASIRVNGDVKYLGSFDLKEDARSAYLNAVKLYRKY